ncbi:YlxR family protein [Nigerium sp.]|uniref:YlxR family protein n=1 Tax=Nigerium sp. TaxID=2042655 RepID=UPI00322203C0
MPERTCVGCRGKAEQADLVRIVVVDGRFAVDARRRLGGRGAYLHPGCVARARKTRAVQRALRAGAGEPAQLAEVLEALEAPEQARSLGQNGT